MNAQSCAEVPNPPPSPDLPPELRLRQAHTRNEGWNMAISLGTNT